MIVGNGSAKDERATWPGAAEAAERLGCSVSTLRRKVAAGQLHPATIDGSLRFPPHELEPEGGDTSSDILAGSAALLRQALAHNERLVSLLVEPARQIVEMLGKENAALRSRVTDLEQRHSQSLAAQEEALSEAHKRQLERATFERDEARKDSWAERRARALESTLKTAGPPVVAALAKRFGLALPESAPPKEPERTSGQVGAHPDSAAQDRTLAAAMGVILNLVGALDDAAIERLRAVGAVSKAEADELRAVRDALAGPEPAEHERHPVEKVVELVCALDESKVKDLLALGTISALEALAIAQLRVGYRRAAPPATVAAPT